MDAAAVAVASIEKLVEQKEAQIEKANFDKYSHVYSLALRFFRKAHVLLYGGLALNELMPKQYKLYAEHTLPDIDVFCVGAKKVAHALVAEYERAGFRFVATKEALHPGTWKVFAEGLQVADITDVSVHVYKKLYARSTRIPIKQGGLGIRIVNIEFLRLTLHAMLSQPYDVHRWGKVYTRLIAFYLVFPPTHLYLASAATTSKTPFRIGHEKRLRACILDFVAKNKYVMFGVDVLSNIISKDPSDITQYMMEAQIPYYQCLVDVPVHSPATELANALRSQGFASAHVSKVFEGDLFVPEHVFVNITDPITNKKLSIAAFYRTPMCLGFVKHGKYRLASVHTLARMYMSFVLSTYPHHAKMVPFLSQILDVLVYHILGTDVVKQLAIDCYGTQSGLITLRREQIERILK